MGGNLNLINQLGEPQKRGNQIFKVQWGEGGDYNFRLKFSVRKNLGGNYENKQKYCYSLQPQCCAHYSLLLDLFKFPLERGHG